MITLNVQMGVNPLLNHRPLSLYRHKECSFTYTIGQNGEVVAWRDHKPVFQMCPSLNAEADQLIAITAADVRQVDQMTQRHKIITLHNDNRLRIWAQQDGTCLNVSSPQVFAKPVVALIAPPVECKFIIALTQQSFFVVDCWNLKVIGEISPKKEAYARFRTGSINNQLQLVIQDGSNRSYNMNISSLLAKNFLDFGKYINDYQKQIAQIQTICQNLNKIQILSHYKKPEKHHSQDLNQYLDVIVTLQQQSLAQIMLCPDLMMDYPELRSLFQTETASISSLHFVSPNSLFLFLGTNKGTLFAIPVSTRSEQSLVFVHDQRRQNAAVMYIRIFEGILFVSWEDGWIGIYQIKNTLFHLEAYRMSQNSNQKSKNEIITTNLVKLALVQQKISSYVKYSLPAYHSTEGQSKKTHFFRLDRNQIIRFDQNTNKITHFRGIPQDIQIYCVMLIQQYIGICTAKGIQLYSSNSFERSIDYSNWQWSDYPFFTLQSQNSVENRRSDYQEKGNNAYSSLKHNNRWIFDKLDYCSNGQSILSQTFGDVQSLANEDFPGYFFLQRGEIQKAIHSKSDQNNSMIIKIKLNRIRKDSWSNAAYILHGNLNKELQGFIAQRATPQQILLKDFQFYTLIPWQDLRIPFLTHQMKDIGKRTCLRRRQAIQGVGKTFTIHFEGSDRLKLSERLLCYEAVATVSLLQCWVLKDSSATDHMVEAVEYFAKLATALFDNSGDITFCKLGVSSCQHISKASINLLISKAITGHYNIHPILQYFLLFQKMIVENRNLLSFSETVWIVHLAIGLIFSGQRIENQHLKAIVMRLTHTIREIGNYQLKPFYLLTALRAFNQGVNKWRNLLQQHAPKIMIDLFHIFFYYDGIASVAPDDKKFNFCFVQIEEGLKRSMKQGIIRTLIYLGKQFPQQFHSVLKSQSVNQKFHACYPASVTQILRQFVKSQKPQTHLVFYVQLLLQCLSPMTPQLRKYVQKNALNTLQLFCSSYSNVSFNQPSQKLSVKTSNHLYIYCLRTSTKWRTINLKDQQQYQGQPIIQMSPKGTYIALLSDKLRIWRLSSGFWSGVLGAFSQDWIFEAKGKDLKWQQNQQSITVINQNPSRNKVFKV